MLRIYDHQHFDGRAYQLRYDFSSSPPGYGHHWSEADMQPLVEVQAKEDDDEPFEPLPLHRAAVDQMELFA